MTTNPKCWRTNHRCAIGKFARNSKPLEPAAQETQNASRHRGLSREPKLIAINWRFPCQSAEKPVWSTCLQGYSPDWKDRRNRTDVLHLRQHDSKSKFLEGALRVVVALPELHRRVIEQWLTRRGQYVLRSGTPETAATIHNTSSSFTDRTFVLWLVHGLGREQAGASQRHKAFAPLQQ
jgi:hypothetical protein